jgi:hypothetical protein
MSPWLIIGFIMLLGIGYEGNIVELREWAHEQTFGRV